MKKIFNYIVIAIISMLIIFNPIHASTEEDEEEKNNNGFYIAVIATFIVVLGIDIAAIKISSKRD